MKEKCKACLISPLARKILIGGDVGRSVEQGNPTRAALTDKTPKIRNEGNLSAHMGAQVRRGLVGVDKWQEGTAETGSSLPRRTGKTTSEKKGSKQRAVLTVMIRQLEKRSAPLRIIRTEENKKKTELPSEQRNQNRRHGKKTLTNISREEDGRPKGRGRRPSGSCS